MAIRHIREAYNQESGDHSICQAARLDYVDGGKDKPQKQIITLDIVHANGTPETVKTPVHAMSENPHEQVRQLAKALKARDGVKDTLPAPYVPPPIDAPAVAWERLAGGTLPSPPAAPPAPPPAAPPQQAGLPKNPWIG
jgi:hypothetical protein